MHGSAQGPQASGGAAVSSFREAILNKVVQHDMADRTAHLFGKHDRSSPWISIGTPSMSSSPDANAKSLPARIGVIEGTVIATGAVVSISSGLTPSIRKLWSAPKWHIAERF
jgi:hypothetical protein